MKYTSRIDDSFVEHYKDKIVPWGPIGYVVYKRTYARRMDEHQSEEWYQTIQRCCNGILALGGAFTQDDIQRLYDHIFHFRGCFSGRALWQLGTQLVERCGGDSLCNCWCVNINEPILPFIFTMEQLMLGGGVGYNLTPESVYSMPIVKHNVKIIRKDERDVDFIVPDNREGWVELLRKVLEAFFYTGKSLTYSTMCIRDRGEPIKSFGGVASGPRELVIGIDDISKIISLRHGQKLRPIDTLDIMNIIGRIVIAGNVRRSAQLALGSVEDQNYINAKNWSKHSIPDWRRFSNNSILHNSSNLNLPDTFWDGYNGNGEPYGLINLRNCRRFGRLVDGDEYRIDNEVIGTNPCAEIALESYEPCNLSEIFLPNCNVEQFHDCATLLTKVCKTISTLPYIYNQTQNVVSKNHRIGVSISGLLEAKHLHDASIFNAVYRHIESTDKEYSKLLKVEPSNKLTTVQPSGTKSKLAGVLGEGIHASWAPYFIQRVQFASNDPLVESCRENGYDVEPLQRMDGTLDVNTMVVAFPIKTRDKALTCKDLTALSQLELQKFLQTFWADNSVSCTVTYKLEELPAIKHWLEENYENGVKTVSFLLHSDHGFKQAPKETITEDQYNIMASKVKPITRIMGTGEISGLECPTGICPIK